MYLPGFEKMLLFFALMLAMLLALASGTPVPLTFLATLFGFYFIYVNRETLIEILYGERALLLLNLDKLIFKKNYVIISFKKRNFCISLNWKKRILLIYLFMQKMQTLFLLSRSGMNMNYQV
ncbi:MAG: hypothetical protein QW760_00630, partial [Thermofilaceae archaeon]